MTSKEALEKLKKESTTVYVDEWLDIIEKDLEVLERYRQIDAIINNSSLTRCTLPNGKIISTDMGYVEDFWNDIKEWIEEDREND